MRFSDNHSDRILVTGVARSGTTLLSQIANSCANGACLSEPHWQWSNDGTVSLDKLSSLDCSYRANDLLPVDKLLHVALKSGYAVAGFKETWRGFAANYTISRPSNDDLLCRYAKAGYKIWAIIRDPIKVWNSQKVTKGAVSPKVEDFVRNYLSLLSFHASPMVYERLIEDPFAEIRRKTGFSIEGSFELHKAKFALGDGFALHSTGIRTRTLDNQTSAEEVEALMPLRTLYASYA